MEFELHRTMDQILWLGLGSYFYSAMLVTTSWSCFMLLGCHWFNSQSLLLLPVLVPSHPGPATFSPCWTHSLVLTWFPWNCCINGVCCLDPTPLQITTLCASHFVYNDKVSEIGEVPKVLNRLLDYQYTLLRRTDCWKKRYQLSSKSSWPWVVPWRPCWNTPLKILPPAALVEGVSLRWFILSCEYCISISEIRAYTCYQTCYQSRRKNDSQKSPYTRECLGNLEISLSNIKISFT